MKRARLKLLIISVILMALIGASLDHPVIFAQGNEQVVRINAERWIFKPNTVTIKVGVPTVLELYSKDVVHGFSCPDLGIRTDIPPRKVTTVRFTPKKTGTFIFRCDVPCGSGHDRMAGTITVVQ